MGFHTELPHFCQTFERMAAKDFKKQHKTNQQALPLKPKSICSMGEKPYPTDTSQFSVEWLTKHTPLPAQ